ncbi:putative lipoprotein [Burkholderia pseudomallei MSHR5596]|nr:putative lipoprotein [Burkholderia pseudomallei MSHR5596]
MRRFAGFLAFLPRCRSIAIAVYRPGPPSGSTCRKDASSVRSYPIFSAPHATNGAPSQPSPSRPPARAGAIAAARLRGTDVKPAAAGRSAGVTTAMTKAVRVGTSICESALRNSNSANVNGSEGAKAAPIRQTLDGICVNTIVFSRPILRDSGVAASWEPAESKPAQKKNRPAAATESPKRCISHSDSSELTTRPPANASTLNSIASRVTMRREGPSGGGAAGAWASGSGKCR